MLTPSSPPSFFHFRFQTSRVKHPEEGFLFPTRTRALKAELQRASDYFATILAFLGFRPNDKKRFGAFFTCFVMIFLGVLWPIFDWFCADVVVADNKLKGLLTLAASYRLLVYAVSILWMTRVSRKWNIDALLFLKVEKLYVSRIAEEKGLGGMWVYAAIIQNFALEVMCLFGPYFVIIAFSKAWWYFNSLNGSTLYSTCFKFMDHVLMDSTSPLYVKILFYFAGLASQSYIQIIYLVPCVYFRMVSSLVLLEMKAYKEMVQPEKDGGKDNLSSLLDEDVSMEHSLASNGSGHALDKANSFQRTSRGLKTSSWGTDPIEEESEEEANQRVGQPLEAQDSMSKFEMEDLPSPSQARRHQMDTSASRNTEEESARELQHGPSRVLEGAVSLPARLDSLGGMRRRRSSVFNRYGVNPFGMYVDSIQNLDDADNLDNGFTDSEDEEELKNHMDEQSFPVLREHSLLQKVLRLISHRFRQFLLLTFIFIFFESFGTLYFILNAIFEMDPKEVRHYNITGVIVRLELSSSALLHIMGLILNVRAILIMTHRLRAVHTIASEQHAHLTCKMNLMSKGEDSQEILKGLGREFEQYMKRQSLLQYMVNHPLGITIYGFLIDREFLRSFHMVAVSLSVFLVSMIMGQSHSKATTK